MSILDALIRKAQKVADKVFLRDRWTGGRASAVIEHRRPTRWLDDAQTIPDPDSYVVVGREKKKNLITTVGRDFLHVQGYATSGIGANGFNYIGLSPDAVSETSASTTLTNEITDSGLQRAQAAVAHTTGQATTVLTKTFTATGTKTVRKAALFTASSSGTMNHVLALSTQRDLVNGDQLVFTITITLGA